MRKIRSSTTGILNIRCRDGTTPLSTAGAACGLEYYTSGKDFRRVQNRRMVKKQTLYGSLEIHTCTKSNANEDFGIQWQCITYRSSRVKSKSFWRSLKILTGSVAFVPRVSPCRVPKAKWMQVRKTEAHFQGLIWPQEKWGLPQEC